MRTICCHAKKKHEIACIMFDFEKPLKLSDEELCIRAQQGCVASRELLWHESQGFVRQVVCKKSRQLCLPPHEMADALQESYFAFHEAVQQYNPICQSNGKTASFKTFLGTVLARSFSNYCRQQRRYRKRFALSLDGEGASSFTAIAEEPEPFPFHPSDGDAISLVEWKESLLRELSSDRLAEALSQLKPKEMRLLAVWLQCRRDKEVAQVLGISTAAAKLRRERLFRRIKQRLAGK